ncbi:hypothetical protein C8P66_11523 [Humitalea rosea]|uniref:Uncharacterized protein n=1 Tax=Humitalea rosea TaxID=990373 RepID=A0A2W7ID84_9PROT|nr:hypothetical protein [Humitalea rosea]PZW43562.1 hypothetical protein C8P66_11523 [Humitalea rosea]
MRCLLLLLVCLSACAELRTPQRSSLPPLGLVSRTNDPGRAAIDDAAAAWDTPGQLAGDPAAMARAAALLEWLAAEIPTAPRWSPIPRQLGYDLGFARTETRLALGIRADAPAPEVTAALAAAAAAGGDAAARARALSGSAFAQGPDGTGARLAAPGTLSLPPTVTANLRREVVRLDAVNGWNQNPVRLEEAVRAGERSTGGLGTFY